MQSWSRRAALALVALGLTAATSPAKLKTAYIVAIVPPGTGKLFITGSDASLGPWNPSGAVMYRDGDRRIYSIEAREGTVFEYKFTLGSWKTEALGADGKPMAANHRIILGEKQVYEHIIPGFQGGKD